MIKPATCLCLLAACGSGLYLYSEKHRTALLDREIGQVIHRTEAARARTGLLRAEWALLNEPGRLSDMAGRYLTLHPMAPTQFVPVAMLAAHLPAAVAPSADAVAEEDDAPPAPVTAEAPPAMLASAATGLPAHHPMQPPGKPDAHAAKLLAHADMRHAPHHVEVADSQDGSMLAHGTPLPLAAPRPLGASVYNAMARPMRASATRTIVASAAPRFAVASAAPSYASAVSSALGGQATLPPPVPYGR